MKIHCLNQESRCQLILRPLTQESDCDVAEKAYDFVQDIDFVIGHRNFSLVPSKIEASIGWETVMNS